MKPRTAFQRRVTEASNRLKPLPEAQEKWAQRKIASHFSFRTKGHINVCSECGAKFDNGSNVKHVVCPECGARLEIHDTRKRIYSEKQVFSTLETVDDLQVQRIYMLHSGYRRGHKAEHEAVEIIRRWYDGDGNFAVEARHRSMNHYVDVFLYSTNIELKKDCYVYRTLADSYVAAGAKLLPYFRKRGVKGRFPNVSPDKLFNGLVTDPRIETLLKSGK